MLAELDEADLLRQPERAHARADRVVGQPILQRLRQHRARPFLLAHISPVVCPATHTTLWLSGKCDYEAIQFALQSKAWRNDETARYRRGGAGGDWGPQLGAGGGGAIRPRRHA